MKKSDKITKLWQYYSSEIKSCINDLKTPGRRKMQIPNILTTSRIVAPFAIVPLSFLGLNNIALALTALAASTDFFDGVLARKLNAKTNLGRELDPVSDKVFASGLLISLSTQNPLILINLGLEIAIATTNFISKLKDNNPKTHLIGKIKTWSLSILVILNLLSLYIPINNILNSSLFAITTLLQITSVTKYILDDKKKDKEKKYEIKNNYEIKIKDKEINQSKTKTLINELKIYRNCLENSQKKTEGYEKNLHL